MTDVIPATKTARREMIRDILAHESIGSQEQLRSLLTQRGIEVTQATLSRDLMEMRATKIRNGAGILMYSVPDVDGGQTHEGEAAGIRLARWCQSLLVTSVRIGHQLVLRTPVGAANLLGSAIDAVRMEEVAGTIAGDDTILVICRSEPEAARVESMLMELAEPGAVVTN
ncbi:arginine repressor [Schaalia vaccimaxillae]|uniref:arginine repressor n=1 Tax=Schaalia vaccimaxillae TaxID=183916 RepID=UPI0003B51CAE|nr:arginine repressor [Schaalia vaccimaxillae]